VAAANNGFPLELSGNSFSLGSSTENKIHYKN
jgi:hypothetical protein